MYRESLCRCEEGRVCSLREMSNPMTGGVIRERDTDTDTQRQRGGESTQTRRGEAAGRHGGAWMEGRSPEAGAPGAPEATSSWERGRGHSVPWSPQTEAPPDTVTPPPRRLGPSTAGRGTSVRAALQRPVQEPRS